jgi:SAM-dependent methyltransferase
MKKIIQKLYHNEIISRVLHTLVYNLQKELEDCETVLDLGCGPDSPLQYCKNIRRSVGVEAFAPYLEKSKKKNIHGEYLDKKIEDLEFPENSFDAVIMIEVLEHLPEKVGVEILKKTEKWARKKVIVSSPNGFVAQKAVDNNPLQRHLSGWDYDKMKKLGYHSHGLAGLKFLRQEVQGDTMGDDLMTSIRFWPKPFWFIVAAISQIFVYFIPLVAFELFCIKSKSRIDKGRSCF